MRAVGWSVPKRHDLDPRQPCHVLHAAFQPRGAQLAIELLIAKHRKQLPGAKRGLRCCKTLQDPLPHQRWKGRELCFEASHENCGEKTQRPNQRAVSLMRNREEIPRKGHGELSYYCCLFALCTRNHRPLCSSPLLHSSTRNEAPAHTQTNTTMCNTPALQTESPSQSPQTR